MMIRIFIPLFVFFFIQYRNRNNNAGMFEANSVTESILTINLKKNPTLIWFKYKNVETDRITVIAFCQQSNYEKYYYKIPLNNFPKDVWIRMDLLRQYNNNNNNNNTFSISIKGEGGGKEFLSSNNKYPVNTVSIISSGTGIDLSLKLNQYKMFSYTNCVIVVLFIAVFYPFTRQNAALR